MNTDNLKCFILVAENLSFARAAEALYISQPAVTKQINALEQELGVTLFIRSTRHVELTPAGMSFYKDAKDIVLKLQMTIDRVKRQGASLDTLRMGLSSPAALGYITPILRRFHEAFPEIRPDIEILSYKAILSMFLDDRLDLLFYYKENMPQKAGISFQELEKDHFTCLMPRDNPLAEKESLSLRDLRNEPIIACNPLSAPLSMASLQQKLLEDHPADKVLYCSSIEVAHSLVAAGMGVSILPGSMVIASPEYARVPLEGKPQLSFGVFYHRKNTNGAMKNFLVILSDNQESRHPT